MDKTGYVYVLSNTYRTVLYIGVTSDIYRRMCQHREGKGSRFATQYKCTSLVHLEEYATMYEAIHREKQLKKWNRAWKLRLIRKTNPELKDISHVVSECISRRPPARP